MEGLANSMLPVRVGFEKTDLAFQQRQAASHCNFLGGAAATLGTSLPSRPRSCRPAQCRVQTPAPTQR